MHLYILIWGKICTFPFKNKLRRSCQRCFFSTGKALQLCTRSNVAVSGNSTVDLLVTAFFSKRTFFTKISSCGPSTRWEGKNHCQLLVVYCILGEILVRMFVDFGDAYVTVRTNCVHSFQLCHFPTLPLFFVLLPAKSKVSMHGEVLSSLWLATPT